MNQESRGGLRLWAWLKSVFGSAATKAEDALQPASVERVAEPHRPVQLADPVRAIATPRIVESETHYLSGRDTEFEEFMDDEARFNGGRWIYSRIAGVSFPNADGSSRQEYVKGLRRFNVLRLRHERGNRFSKTAVLISGYEHGEVLGYVPDNQSREVCSALRDGLTAAAIVCEIGKNPDDLWGAKIGILIWREK
jgi:hypothetical protein